MIKKNFFYTVIVLSVVLFNTNINSQTFGFGCLGFFGGYGGVVYQSFKADGLNQFVKYFNEQKFSTLDDPLQDYYGAIGYRVGVNFFRATWESGFILTAKGYYQSLSRTREASETLIDGNKNYTFELDLKNWAVGIDFGYAITSFLSWKIVDGSINFNNVSLTSTINSPEGTEVSKYKSESGVLGYSVGTGIIISIIKDYISLEGLAGFTRIKIEKLNIEEGDPYLDDVLSGDENNNFIESGGFTAVIQLNIGFPL
ncbi:MAG: hypothetical protein ACE1ZQ_03160 [Ignavibacteriaceae bacterium]